MCVIAEPYPETVATTTILALRSAFVYERRRIGEKSPIYERQNN